MIINGMIFLPVFLKTEQFIEKVLRYRHRHHYV